MTEKYIIPIDAISKDFDEHLAIENNNNLLFSGKFGLGKTYFLKEFFNINDKYETYHLFPVNYQISSNEDIIDLLKYDILVELSKNEDIFKNNKIEDFTDLANMIYLFGSENKLEILKTLLLYIPKLGRPLKETISLFQKFGEFKEEIEKGEKGNVNTFLNDIKEKNINENDNLSELIKEKINKIKGDKKSILILDDLDRIDPEHIFRIMNVFGAHFNIEHNTNINKFGFDKIILVGDYDNLVSIFHHKYGINTDFNGYINKFYSSEIYFFDNSKIIESKIKDIIQSIKYGDDYFKGALQLDSGYMEFMLREILENSALLKTKNKLSLRELLKGTNYIISGLNNKNYGGFSSEQLYVFDTSLRVLISIFGCKKINLINILEDIKKTYKVGEFLYSKSAFRHIIFIFINSMYKIDNINMKYNDYKFITDSGQIAIGEISDYKLIYLFYDVLVDYIDNKIN